MKKSSLIAAIIVIVTACTSYKVVYAQEKTENEKEKELQQLIDEQKKTMIGQKKAQEEMQRNMLDKQEEIDKAMKDAQVKIEEARKNGTFRVYNGDRTARAFSYGTEPYLFTPGIDVFHGMMGEGERTTWDFSKSVKETTFSRDYTFDVESTVNTVVMAVNGDCKSGNIRIRIVMPNGKTYSDIVIDEFGNLNWRKSFTISETENKDKAGAWKFDISSEKATGYFKISLQTY